MSTGDDKSNVTKDLCKVLHANLQKEVGEVKDHIEKIDETINSLKTISEENQLIIKILMEERSRRMSQQHSTPVAPIAPVPQDKPKVWLQPWFKYIVFTACCGFIALIVLAVGKELIGQYIEALKLISK